MIYTDIMKEELKKAKFQVNLMESTAYYYAKMMEEIERVTGLKLIDMSKDADFGCMVPLYRIGRDYEEYGELKLGIGKQSFRIEPKGNDPFDVEEPAVTIYIKKIHDYEIKNILESETICDKWTKERIENLPLWIRVTVTVPTIPDNSIWCVQPKILTEFIMYIRRYDVTKKEREEYELFDRCELAKGNWFTVDYPDRKIQLIDPEDTFYCLENVPKSERKTVRQVLKVFKRYHDMLND